MMGRPSRRSGVVKRGADLAAAAILLVVLAPVLIVLALVVRWRLGSPVLFRQVRPGLGGRPFTMTKFRSMRDAAGPDLESHAAGRRAAEIAHDIGATQHRKPVPNVFHFTQKNPTPR